jgi:DNA-binding CsgD family transcriptional regulator
VSDPELHPLTAEAVLRQVFGLTPAETRFGIHLLQHKSLKEAANSLGISLNTAWTHLKRLFEKTGPRQQSELVRGFLNGVGQLRF